MMSYLFGGNSLGRRPTRPSSVRVTRNLEHVLYQQSLLQVGC
jgi:hypothetical protein